MLRAVRSGEAGDTGAFATLEGAHAESIQIEVGGLGFHVGIAHGAEVAFYACAKGFQRKQGGHVAGLIGCRAQGKIAESSQPALGEATAPIQIAWSDQAPPAKNYMNNEKSTLDSSLISSGINSINSRTEYKTSSLYQCFSLFFRHAFMYMRAWTLIQ